MIAEKKSYEWSKLTYLRVYFIHHLPSSADRGSTSMDIVVGGTVLSQEAELFKDEFEPSTKLMPLFATAPLHDVITVVLLGFDVLFLV